MTDTTRSGNDVTTANAAQTDWGAVATDKFVTTVDTVKQRTTGPLLKAARALVYGLVILVAAIMLVILLIAGLVRALDVVLPGNVWAAHLVSGILCLIIGMFAWSKRR